MVKRIIQQLRRLCLGKKMQRAPPHTLPRQEPQPHSLDLDEIIKEYKDTTDFIKLYSKTYKRLTSDERYRSEVPGRIKRHKRVNLSTQDYIMITILFDKEYRFLKN